MHLHIQAKFRRVSVAVTTTIREDNIADQNTVLLQGVWDIIHIAIIRVLSQHRAAYGTPPTYDGEVLGRRNVQWCVRGMTASNSSVFWSLVLSSLMVVVVNTTETLANYEDWNFNSGNYLFTTDTK